MDDHCDVCGYDGRSLDPGTVAARLEQLPIVLRTSVAEISDTQLRLKEPGRWSVIEYVGHLKDVMAFHRWLIERALAEDQPVIAAGDPDEAVEGAKYNCAELAELLDQVDRRLQRLCLLLWDLDLDDRQRRAILDEGVQIDVDLIARNALHESVHHVLDIERVTVDPPAAMVAIEVCGREAESNM